MTCTHVNSTYVPLYVLICSLVSDEDKKTTAEFYDQRFLTQ